MIARVQGSLALRACIALAIGAMSSATPAQGAPRIDVSVEQIGTTAAGRPLRIARRCAPDADVDVLVVGVIHGNETAGVPVVGQLARGMPPARTCLWLLAALNEDGRRAGTRQNGRGVDLNRNFPFDWRGGGSPWSTFYPGRARASEPETQAALALIRRVRPDVTIWYHQHLTMVIRPPLPWRRRLAARYEQVSGLAVRSYPGGRLHGTATSWQHAEQPRSAALVVELPAGALPSGRVRAHADAVRAIAQAARADGVPSP